MGVGVGGSLGSVDFGGEEGSPMVGEGVTTMVAVAAQGINAGAVGRSDTALIGDPLGVAGAVTTAGDAGDNAIEVGGL